MHGVDIVITRAAGVNFIYENSKIKSFSYHPSKSPESVVEIQSALDDHEANIFRSLIRLKHELKCALALLEKYSPELLLMDGSLLPLPSDIPPKDSELYSLYQEVLGLYQTLYSNKDSLLCGVIKDSRARRMSNLKYSDSVLCSYLLDECERTEEMNYFGDHPPKELASLGKHVKIFYLKPAKHDLPLRIEVLGDEIDKAASIICSLSAISEHFAYPAILIEADMCAALNPNEMQSIESYLQSMAGIKPLRRNFRPFR
jgi:hypothetical protein